MNREEVMALLDALNIAYHLAEHEAVFTMAEMEALRIASHGMVCKNLFLKDAKGRQHFLVVVSPDKQVDLKALSQQLGCKPLGFASEERLQRYLGLAKGEVTPFGVLNDRERVVTVVFDQDLQDEPLLGVHPNDNRGTIWLKFADLCRVMDWHGSPWQVVRI